MKIDTAKSNYIIQNLQQNCKDPKKFWRIIKDMIEPDDTWDIETVQFAENMCDFSKVVHPTLDNNVEVKFAFQPPELDDLMYIIRDIDDNMSSCVEGINMKMCKRIISMIPEKFLLLFANSMYTGVFPSQWSILTVTLLPEAGDKTCPGNWRPISNTNIYAKILEKSVHKQVTHFVYSNNIISESQYGFVLGWANIGYDDRVRRWFKSYNSRSQCVKIGDKKSDVERVLNGAAQGTVLGHTIFILYFNAVATHVRKCKLSMFADDCIIYQSRNMWDSVRVKLQFDLNNIVRWTSENSL